LLRFHLVVRQRKNLRSPALSRVDYVLYIYKVINGTVVYHIYLHNKKLAITNPVQKQNLGAESVKFDV